MNIMDRKVIIPAAFAVLAVTMVGLVVLGPISVLAQNSTNTTSNGTQAKPNITGSVSIQNATNAFVKNNVKINFNDAANTAKAQMTNGVVTSGRLSEVQGFLTYTFMVANYDAGTMKIVIVDAGNGSVLYTSNDMPLYNGGLGGYGCGRGPHHHFGGFGDEDHWKGSTTSGNNGSTTGTSVMIPGSNI